jgi:hypothetical protein
MMPSSDVELAPPVTKAWFAIRDQVKKRSLLALRLIEADALRVSEAADLAWTSRRRRTGKRRCRCSG